MKRLYVMVAALPLLALVAAGQDDPENLRAKLKAELDSAMSNMKVIGLSGAAMGPTVKGAPYSAVEVSENNQVLADGTRIHNESQTTVYRDSEGRVRRETPNQTTIMDPVNGVSYFLNPKTLTATKAPLALPVVFNRRAVGGETKTFTQDGVFAFGPAIHADTVGENATFEARITKDGVTTVTVNGKTVDPSTITMGRSMTINGSPVDDQAFAMAQDKMKAEMAFTAGAGGVLRSKITAPGKTEALGTQVMEGVNAEGTRQSTTLETGAVGNDRPIQMVNERWFSADLKTVVMTRHSDPRTGEEIFRLINISRTEPGADLFQVPANYQILDRK
jgi:hypothetical protein